MGTEGVCAGCVAGKYRSNLVSDVCADCPVGKFSQDVNSETDTCEDCAAGTYAADDRSQCLQCAAGHYKISAGSEGCWGTLEIHNVARRCGAGGAIGPCPIYVISERQGFENTRHRLVDGDAPDNSFGLVDVNIGSATTDAATIVIDLERSYTLSHYRMWISKAVEREPQQVASMSDSRHLQSQDSCSDGTLNVCSTDFYRQTIQLTKYCEPGATGRYFCLRVPEGAWYGHEISLFALLWSPCPANRYRREDMCVECPVNSHTPPSNTATTCVCNAGFSSTGSGDCTGCAPGTYRNAPDWRHACRPCPHGSTSSAAAVGISQCLCASGVDIAEYVPTSVVCSSSCGCSPSTLDENGVVTFGPAAYTDNAHCVWVIASSAKISLQFSSFDTQKNSDYVVVTRCATAACDSRVEQLRNTSGGGADVDLNTTSETTAEHPYLQISFKSDASKTFNGFIANWWTSGPMYTCHRCAPGLYRVRSATTGLDSCALCPAHSYSPQGSNSVVECKCNAGYSALPGPDCTACRVGKYIQTGAPGGA